ncbi:hypothetical protein PVAND_011136 [Polypedilum vanderplanki]|uniref:Uncharacterized protein n=1 Tax=Polypedilum vanderplanki TaxID=319348 RepID=A0A9J6CJI0_POLVA|nr:hypothetical protein PVAND_011136 [Polypedilum vanderplanki]
MNKIFIIAFITTSLIASSNCGIKDFVDDGIYTTIHAILKNQHPTEPEKTDCIIADFRRNKVADQFYTTDLILDHGKLIRKVQPYLDEANFKCSLILFFQSPLGICAILALFLLAFSFICCLIRCICC